MTNHIWDPITLKALNSSSIIEQIFLKIGDGSVDGNDLYSLLIESWRTEDIEIWEFGTDWFFSGELFNNSKLIQLLFENLSLEFGYSVAVTKILKFDHERKYRKELCEIFKANEVKEKLKFLSLMPNFHNDLGFNETIVFPVIVEQLADFLNCSDISRLPTGFISRSGLSFVGNQKFISVGNEVSVVGRLDLSNCNNLVEIGSDFTALALNISGCSALRVIPNDVRVQDIDIRDTSLVRLPSQLYSDVRINSFRDFKIDHDLTIFGNVFTKVVDSIPENIKIMGEIHNEFE